MAWPQAKMLGPWRTALDKVTLDVSKSKFVTFSLARFGRFEPPCAHNRPMKDAKNRRRRFAKTPTFNIVIFNIFTPKKSKDRLRWGHAIAVVVQKRLGLFPGYVWKQPEMAFLTRFASLLSSASV